MKIVLLDADTLGKDVDLGIFAALGEFSYFGTTSKEQTKQRIEDADIIITNKVIIDDELMSKSKVKLIALTATGMNNIDLNAAKKYNISVKNVAGYSTNSVAQQCFANLLALLNHTSYYDKYCKDSNGWAQSPVYVHLQYPIYELANKKFCVVGLGNIGKKVAQIAKSFGCDVCYYSTSKNNINKEFSQIDFDEVLNCDIISIHAPLNENTKNLFDEQAIKKLKNSAILANYGRGGIVDEEAIAKEIDTREIYFISDVLEYEPMLANHPFLSVKNKNRLLLSPHIAWASVEARKTLMQLVAKNIKDFLKDNK